LIVRKEDTIPAPYATLVDFKVPGWLVMETMSALFTFRSVRVLLTILVVCLLAFKANPIYASPNSNDGASSCRDAIQAAYTQMTQAFANNVLEQSAQLFAADYRQIDPHGHALDKDGSLKKFQWERDCIRTIQSTCQIANITEGPDGIHVQMATHSTGTGVKRVLFFKVMGSFINDMRVEDLWVNTPMGLRLKTRQLIQDDSHMQKD
jgi:hypothetical protein